MIYDYPVITQLDAIVCDIVILAPVFVMVMSFNFVLVD